MSILITGAGLLGCEVAKLLAARKRECILADIRQPSKQRLEEMPGVIFEPLDVTDPESLDALILRRGVREIVHTAAVLSNGMRANPVAGLRVNLLGTTLVLDAARRLKLGRVVTISSTTILYSGFGVFGPDPILEDAPLRLVSDRPRSLYAATKLASEHIGFLYRDLYHVDHIALRLAAVVGGDTSNPSSVPGQLFGSLIAAARAGGRCHLDNPLLLWGGQEEFVDLRDCARAVVAALDAEKPAQGVYNIAHPKLWTLAKVVDAVKRLHGSFECDVPDDIQSGFAGFPFLRPAPSGTDAATNELNFSCEHDLLDSLGYWWADK